MNPHNEGGVSKVGRDTGGNAVSDVYHVTSSITNLIDIWSLSWVGIWWVGCIREEESGKEGGERGREREKGGWGEVENRKKMRILYS